MKTHTCLKPLKTLALWLLLLATGFAYAADTYLVVDLSGGKDATNYPVSYLDAVPSGGWTDAHKTDKLVLRKIPAGTFMMGSPAGELGRASDETQHQVTLTKDFYIGVFKVTQRQWELVMGNKPSYFNNATYYATRPVEQVSYYQIRENPVNSDDPASDWPANTNVNADSFMGKLRAKTGLTTFDLPTESQWEYACRANTTTALNSGKNLTSTTECPNMSEVGRYAFNGGNIYTQTNAPNTGTAVVGSYLPNTFGLYDMHGNAFHWCLDWYGSYPGTVDDPKGATSGSGRVIRGGGFPDLAHYCRSASRVHKGSYGPASINFNIGFRLTMTLTDSVLDTDLDGLPDVWEIEHFGNLTASDGTGDFDRDGRTDAQELADNTDPANPGSTIGLVAYYPLDGNANDGSGNGKHGTEHGSLTYADGIFGSAGGFDGVDDYVDIEQLLFNGTQSATITFWARSLGAQNTYAAMVSQGHLNSTGFAFQYGTPSPTTTAFVYGFPAATYSLPWSFLYYPTDLETDTEWHSYSVTVAGNTLVIYFDGELQSTAQNGVAFGTFRFNIGRDVANGDSSHRCFNGLIDDVRIYNRALSSTEVSRLYTASAQPTTHLVTLHPGDHGDIPGVPSGADYVTNVTHGAAFTPPTPVPDAGYTFTRWDPTLPATITTAVTAEAKYELITHPDLSLTTSDFRILNASGTETSNPAVGEAVTLEVTLHNTGAAATTGNILVQAFLDGTPSNLAAYDLTAFSVVASGEVVASIPAGGSATLLLPWTAAGPDRVATLTAVAEFAANRAQSQANAAGASLALPVAEGSFSNNSAGGAIQIGLPAGEPGNYGIAVTASAPANMVSGVSYTLSGTAAYDWGTNEPVLGALVTVTVNGTNYTGRTVAPDGAWSVALNGLPTGYHLAHVVVDDGRLFGFIDLELRVSGGAATIDLHITQMGFDSGIYRADGETGHAVTGGNVVLKALVRNDGNTAAGAFAVAFKNPAGGVICTVPVAGLAAFGETWVTASSGWAAVAGTSVLSALADSGGAVAETSETNNARSATVIGNTALPDLIVTDLSWPGSPTAGDTVTLTATVSNQGGAALPSGGTFSTAFSLGGTVPVSLTADLLPGAGITVQTTWTAVAGSHTLSATADSGGAVAEDYETNNTRATTITVRQSLPDLQPYYRTWQDVSGLSFNPSQPVAGGAVTVTCDIYNTGTVALASGRSFDVIFSAGGTPFATNTVTLAADLAPGAKIPTAAVWTSVSAGNVVIAVAVDANSSVIEENETNNGTAAGLTVYPAAAGLVAADINSSPLQPRPGAAVTLTATVLNNGGAAGGNGMTVEFFAGSTNLTDRIGTAVLAADVAPMGGTGTVTYNWTAPGTPGPVTIHATVNGTAVQRSITITPNPAPNLQVFSQDISVSPELPQTGQAVMVSATVRNTEGSAASNFTVRFAYNSPAGQWVELGQAVTVAALAVGSNTTVTAATPIMVELSAYSVKVEILPNATQGDADTGDNAATSSFLLHGTPMANAGTNAACFVGQPVTLDGTASRKASTYAWSLIEKPAGSLAELSGAATAQPSLIPDKPGIYRARLIVGDGLQQSMPDTVTVTARWINLTLHPGLYGTIVGADPNGDFTATVNYGDRFPTVAVTPNAGFISAGWTPVLPVTVVGDFEAWAQYRQNAETLALAADQIRASKDEQQRLGLFTEESIGTIVAAPLLIAVDPLTREVNLKLQLQRNDTLDPTTWQPLGPLNSWTYPNPAGKAFYRLMFTKP